MEDSEWRDDPEASALSTEVGRLAIMLGNFLCLLDSAMIIDCTMYSEIRSIFFCRFDVCGCILKMSRF